MSSVETEIKELIDQYEKTHFGKSPTHIDIPYEKREELINNSKGLAGPVQLDTEGKSETIMGLIVNSLDTDEIRVFTAVEKVRIPESSPLHNTPSKEERPDLYDLAYQYPIKPEDIEKSIPVPFVRGLVLQYRKTNNSNPRFLNIPRGLYNAICFYKNRQENEILSFSMYGLILKPTDEDKLSVSKD
jgi:hypothetical protein